jgi:hypothetical protein
MLTASMARIEVLPYNHFYDFLLFEFHVATWCIVPCLQVAYAYGAVQHYRGHNRSRSVGSRAGR